jgi:hypothetical protein
MGVGSLSVPLSLCKVWKNNTMNDISGEHYGLYVLSTLHQKSEKHLSINLRFTALNKAGKLFTN